MRAAEPLSLLASGAAERAFANDAFVRRLAKTAQLKPGARVLLSGVGDGSLGLLLAQSLKCQVVLVGTDGDLLEKVKQKAGALAEQVTVHVADPAQWQGTRDFQLVVASGVLTGGFLETARRLREELLKDGRFCRIHPVQVGLGTAPPAWKEAWEAQLEEPLWPTGALLMKLEEAGFEPEGAEALSNTELDTVLQAQPPTEAELALFPALAGQPRATCAAVLGRRRETGEKPPVSGDRG